MEIQNAKTLLTPAYKENAHVEVHLRSSATLTLLSLFVNLAHVPVLKSEDRLWLEMEQLEEAVTRFMINVILLESVKVASVMQNAMD